MAELQTVSAVFDLLKLAWSAGIFLKKVKDADAIAREVCERVERLSSVLEGVKSVLQKRAEAGSRTTTINYQPFETRIRESLQACSDVLHHLDRQVGGFEADGGRGLSLLERFKIVCKHPSIAKRQRDLEARINILQTDLLVLQLTNQANTDSAIDTNQVELLRVLTALSDQVARGNRVLNALLRENSEAAAHPARERLAQDTVDEDAVSRLNDCLRDAEDVYERFTSEHLPDDRSLRMQDRLLAHSNPLSPVAIGTPESEPVSPFVRNATDASPIQALPETPAAEEETIVLPVRMLNRFIADYRDRAATEMEKAHYNQAELCLEGAFRYSEAREKQHGVKFQEKVRLSEDLAFVYQKQAKFAEAVAKVHELMRESDDDAGPRAQLAIARQNQLLAAIYFDRHQHSAASALRSTSDDLEMAERYAYTAFAKRDGLVDVVAEGHSDDAESHREGMQLLVSILEARGKTVESSAIKDMLNEASSSSGDSLRRPSTMASRPAVADFEIVEDRYDTLLRAIKSGDSEYLSNPTSFQEVAIDKLSGRGEGKTLLMHAVESSDESSVHRLLDPGLGGDVDARNRKGRTALHLAASQGRHEILRSLLLHDADIEARDNDGETPIVKAVQADHREIVEELSSRGANMATKNIVRLDEWCLLHHAIHLTTPRMAALLLDLAPELRDSVDQAGKTPLHHCAEDANQQKLNIAKTMLEHRHGVDVNAIDSSSRNALHFAATKPVTPQREAMVQLLLQHGAVIDETRPPPRMRDYPALRSRVKPRRASALTRHDSISTEGSVGTVSTGTSRLSRVFSSRMGFR